MGTDMKTGGPHVVSTAITVQAKPIDFDPDETKNNDDQVVVSVADRAKWLRGAFTK